MNYSPHRQNTSIEYIIAYTVTDRQTDRCHKNNNRNIELWQSSKSKRDMYSRSFMKRFRELRCSAGNEVSVTNILKSKNKTKLMFLCEIASRTVILAN